MKATPLLLAVFATASSLACAATTAIPANADTTLHETFSANNFGARTMLQAGATSGASTRSRALLSFDIAGAIPPGATILAARITLVATDAPSPDWFVAVRGLPLIEHGQWVQSKTVVLYPWDTGTDSGASFSSPDSVTTPRGVITRIVTPPLGTNGNTPPMGTFTFTLVRIVPAP